MLECLLNPHSSRRNAYSHDFFSWKVKRCDGFTKQWRVVCVCVGMVRNICKMHCKYGFKAMRTNYCFHKSGQYVPVVSGFEWEVGIMKRILFGIKNSFLTQGVQESKVWNSIKLSVLAQYSNYWAYYAIYVTFTNIRVVTYILKQQKTWVWISSKRHSVLNVICCFLNN